MGAEPVVSQASVLDPAARAELEAALARLRAGSSALVRAADLLGRFMGTAGQAALVRLGLGGEMRRRFGWVAEIALKRAYDVALLGVETGDRVPGSPVVVVSGALGGLAGLAGFVPDSTLTTLVILRDIARIARAHGEDLATEDARRACLEVFALNGGPERDSEFGYFSARLLFQGRGLAQMIGQIAARYGVVLGDKLMAQAVPLAGAVAGATLNGAFHAHYRNLAEAHFTIRRLERTYGRAAVREASGAWPNPEPDAPFIAA